MFESFAKKLYFSRQSMKLIIKVCLVLCVGPIGIRNQDPKPLADSFDSTNSMTVLELTNKFPLKIMFFEVRTIVSICVKI